MMLRLLTCLLVALALSGCALAAAPGPSQAAVAVGIGDQDPATFTDPLFDRLQIRRARVIVPWRVALVRSERESLDAWLSEADTAGVEPLVSFAHPVGSNCPRRPCHLPTVSQFTRAFRAFRRRWPFVRIISPWNEANHRSQPTFRNPKRAALYYNVVRKYCRGCKIVAADVIDERNMESWLDEFQRHAKKPRIWGLHNYRDTNPRRNQRFGGTARFLEAVRGQVWLTETGGIVKFTLPSGGRLFRYSEGRANRAMKRMFSLAKRNRKRIKRLYIYHWKQAGDNRFDAALLREDGKPRPAYRTVGRYLRSPFFNP